MSDIVIMPKADYQATCDAIRARTGKTDLIKSGDLKTEIEAITGGTSADVCYVTFLSDDGTVEYGKKAVAVGDDCADPIERGVFDTPTKESTVQYDYTFDGWALDTGGEKDSTALQAVTEDRTVYANYIAAVRYYTITYYDGETVLKTETLAYGSTPSYTPGKSGYSFTEWEPALTSVAGDASYYAQWEEKITFASSTWGDIARVCEEGKASSNFAVGDIRTIPITLTNGTVMDVDFKIIGIDHDNLEEGTKAGLSIASVYPIYASDIGVQCTIEKCGWSESILRSSLANVAEMLPIDLQEHLKPVVKASVGNDVAALEETVDIIWTPSITEYGYSWSGSLTGQGKVYSPYLLTTALGGDLSSYGQSADGVGSVKVMYITRSRYTSLGNQPFNVVIDYDGSLGYNADADYVRICFCV